MINSTSESGRSMVEILGVLVIIGILSVGAMSGISYAFDVYRTNETITMIDEIAQNVMDLYSWDRALPLTTESAKMKNRICNNDVWDTDCLEGENATFQSPFGGNLTVEPYNADHFKIVVADLPTDTCSQLASLQWVSVYQEKGTDSLNPKCETTTFTVYSK